MIFLPPNFQYKTWTSARFRVSSVGLSSVRRPTESRGCRSGGGGWRAGSAQQAAALAGCKLAPAGLFEPTSRSACRVPAKEQRRADGRDGRSRSGPAGPRSRWAGPASAGPLLPTVPEAGAAGRRGRYQGLEHQGLEYLFNRRGWSICSI